MAEKRDLDAILGQYQNIIKETQAQNDLLNKQLNYVKDIAQKEQIVLNIKKNQSTILEAETVSLEKTAKLIQENVKKDKELLEIKKKLGELTTEEEDKLNKQIEDGEKLLETTIRKVAENEKVLLQLEQEAKLRQQINDQQEKLVRATSEISNKLFGISRFAFKDSLLGIITQGRQLGLSLVDSLGSVAKSFAQTINPTNLFAVSLKNTIDFNKQLDTVQSEFSKSTGTSGQYNQVIKDMGRNHLSLGIDIQDASNAIISLKAQMTDFSMLDRRTKSEIALLTAGMKELGISTEVTAKNFQMTQKVLGFTASESMRVQKELLAEARMLEIAPSQIMEDFSKVMPQLSAFGRQGVQIFKDLSAVAKSTGIAVDELVNYMAGFETFEGAATRAGQLNAILGGTIDAVQMTAVSLEKGPYEALKLVKSSLDKTGLSFESMSFAQRKAIASALGMKDVQMLAKLMTSDLNKMSEASKQEAMRQEEMNTMMRQAQPIIDKLKQLMLSFTIALEPVIDGIRNVLDWVLKTNEALGGWIGYIGAGIGGLIVFSKILAPVVNTVKMFSGNITNMAGSLEKASPMISAGGNAAGILSSKLIPLSITIAAVGIAVYLASSGISKLVDSFKGMFSLLIDHISVVPKLASGIALIGASLLSFGAGAIVAGASLPVLAAGMLTLGASLMLIKTKDLEALSAIFNSISKLTSATVSNVKSIAVEIKEMANSLDRIPIAKAVTLTNTVKQVADASIKLNESKTAVSENIVSRIENTMTKGGEVKEGKTGLTDNGMRVINLNIDGRPLKRFILDVINTELNPRRVIY